MKKLVAPFLFGHSVDMDTLVSLQAAQWNCQLCNNYDW